MHEFEGGHFRGVGTQVRGKHVRETSPQQFQGQSLPAPLPPINAKE